ncbi:hypothetical protein [Geobacillus sp. BMUD]|uniref:hypothetical protein n=1 Tax=Geobacillus sp. BMUD TaxID=2508876 RepID=UPI0014928677|nr:hypothetical protein [Geobacillus sp. BMUD]
MYGKVFFLEDFFYLFKRPLPSTARRFRTKALGRCPTDSGASLGVKQSAVDP